MVVYAAKMIMEYNSVDRRLSLHSSFIHFHTCILGYNILAAGTHFINVVMFQLSVAIGCI